MVMSRLVSEGPITSTRGEGLDISIRGSEAMREGVLALFALLVGLGFGIGALALGPGLEKPLAPAADPVPAAEIAQAAPANPSVLKH